MRELEFFFDYASPWSYLADTQVDHLVYRTGAILTYRPMLLGGLFKATGGPIVPLHTYPEAKQHYYRQDLERWARHWGAPFKWNSHFPFNTVKALRLTMLVDDTDKELLVERLFTACWIEDRDPDDLELLTGLLGELGLDRELVHRLDHVETKASLRWATDEAVARGICGAPTFVVDGERKFWGQDRLHFVEAALQGWRPRSERLEMEGR